MSDDGFEKTTLVSDDEPEFTHVLKYNNEEGALQVILPTYEENEKVPIVTAFFALTGKLLKDNPEVIAEFTKSMLDKMKKP